MFKRAVCVQKRSPRLEIFPDEADPSEITSRQRSIPIIRLVEMDGFQGAVGVACLDPASPTTDQVHGVKFIDREDITEEISTLSDPLSMAGKLIGPGR